jgi:hypothetical protein
MRAASSTRVCGEPGAKRSRGTGRGKREAGSGRRELRDCGDCGDCANSGLRDQAWQ